MKPVIIDMKWLLNKEREFQREQTIRFLLNTFPLKELIMAVTNIPHGMGVDNHLWNKTHDLISKSDMEDFSPEDIEIIFIFFDVLTRGIYDLICNNIGFNYVDQYYGKEWIDKTSLKLEIPIHYPSYGDYRYDEF